MKEFDFDELDKAVNSLMGDVSQPADVSQESQVTPTTPLPVSAPTLPVDQKSEALPSITDASTQEPVESPSLPVLSSPATKRSGRFMDVVHPSSDMKTTRGTGSSSREGISITPPVSSSMGTPSVFTPTPPAEIESNITTVEKDSPSLVVSDWPDPIAVHENTQSNKPEEHVDEDQSAAPTPVIDSSFDLIPEPLSSPFLSDAKVEKRPLGGSQMLDQAIADDLSKVSEDEPPVSVSLPEERQNDSVIEDVPDDNVKIETPDTQLSPLIEEKVPLPEELASDLVAIEAGNATVNEEKAEASTQSQAVAVGTGSIPQQYTEQPSTGDESHAAIYDNEVSQPSLLHPSKKKNGWVIVVWVVLILILGVASGAALWYLGII